MKKVFYVILLLMGLSTIKVNAANYQLKELIPLDTKTTIVTNNFSYKDFYYNNNELEAKNLHNNFIIFSGIKNLTDQTIPVSMSVAVFDKNKKNLSVINYCSTKDKTSVTAGTVLKPNEEKSYVLEVAKKNLPDKKTVEDIKYFAILSDNSNCNSNTSFDYVGYSIEDINMGKNTTIDKDSMLLIQILTILGVILLIIFIYKFLFTGSYRNFDGEDVRTGYKNYNKELKEEREKELKEHPPVEKEPVKVKSDEVIAQEEQAKHEDKSSTDLHNLYK